MEVIATIVGLLAAVTALSLIARRINAPSPAVMVVAGLLISLVPWFPRVRLEPQYVFLLFLPPLMYSAAWEMPWRDFRNNLRPILLLAIGFVIFTTFAVAGVMHAAVDGLTWAAAVTLGAIVSPPDPISAIAVLRRAGAPNRLRIILEGEGLVNDASGLTLFSIASGAVYAGSFTFGHGAVEVVRQIGGGVGIGLVGGVIVAWVHRRVDDRLAGTLITLLSPYAAFLPAEAAGCSGVLATVVMGLYVSRKAPHLFSPQTRQTAIAVWDTFTFMLNGLVFVLIGLQLRYVLANITGASDWELAGYVLLLTVTLVLARMAWVFPAAYLPRLFGRRGSGTSELSWREVFFVGYTGMRGVVSLAAALSVPFVIASGAPFPRRGIIVFLTFWAILITLVIQSLSLPWLIRILKIRGGGQLQCEERDARLQAVRAALKRLDDLRQDPNAPAGLLDRLDEHYRLREQILSESGSGRDCGIPERPGREIRRQLIDAEREQLLRLYDADKINDEVLQRIAADLDLEDLRLSSQRE